MKRLLVSMVCLAMTIAPVYAQSKNKIGVGTAIGIGIPDGANISVGVKFMPELTVRAGLGIIPKIQVFKHRFTIEDVDAMKSYKDALEYVPGVNSTFNISSTRAHLMVDYHPFRNFFRVTAGLYMGAVKLGVAGQLINAETGKSIMNESSTLDPNDMPKISIYDNATPDDKLTIQPDKDAKVSADVRLGRTIQPYLGVGFGYYVPNSKVSFICDLGVLFSGKAHATSPNVLAGDLNKMADYSKEAQKILYYTQILPVLNLGVSIKLF